MKNYKLSLILFLVAIILCLAGCKQAADTLSDTPSSNDLSSVPIVIVDDEAEADGTTQSETDELLDKWESTTPSIKIELDESYDDSENSSEEQKPEGSSDAASSEKETPSQNNSSDQSSSDTPSGEDTDSSTPDEQDDGYFDVAVQSIYYLTKNVYLKRKAG